MTTSSPADSTATAESLPLLFDDDGSRDGLAALLYLLEHPEVSIQAVSISYGEAHPARYIQHVGRVLDDLGFAGMALGAGQDAPLASATAFPDWLRQLSDNFWDYPLPDAARTYAVQDAAQLMVSTLNSSPRPMTIFQSGTFTTLAQALRLDPQIKGKIAAVYFMGGAVHVPGNITNLIPESSDAVAEWNIYADPLAAREVFESGLSLYMVPLDATNQLKLRQEEIRGWHNGDEKARLVADLYEMMFSSYGFETVEIFDLTAAAIMLRPELCRFQALHLDVVTDEGPAVGQTAADPAGQPNVQVCLEPHVDQIREALNESFSRAPTQADMPSVDPIVGTWKGSAFNNGLAMQVSITIDPTCQLGKLCGRFDIPTASCSGTFTWVGMDGNRYQFQAGDKTAGCGEGVDYLLPQSDGSVIYISQGDYGETNGTLQREP